MGLHVWMPFVPVQRLIFYPVSFYSSILTRDHCENWFEVIILGRLINRCIITLPSVEVDLHHSWPLFLAIATRGRLNHNRTQTGDGNHLLPCPRLGSIFKLIQPGYEFGGCEVGKSDKGEEDTKRIEDFNKLVTTMGHILHQEAKLSWPQELPCSLFGCIRIGTSVSWSDMALKIPALETRIKDIKLLLKSMWLVKVIFFCVFYDENQCPQILRKPLMMVRIFY